MKNLLLFVSFSILLFRSFSQSDSSFNFYIEYLISPVNHIVINGNDKQNFGTGISLMLDVENTFEFRSSIIYDFVKYKANFQYSSYSPPACLCPAPGTYSYIDTNYIFNIIRVPLSFGLIFLAKEKINPFINFGLQYNFAKNNVKIYDIINYEHQQTFAFYIGEGVKYNFKDKIAFRTEIGQFFSKKLMSPEAILYPLCIQV